MKVCAQPGCPELTTGSHCPAHTRAPWAGSDRRSRLPKDWERRRRTVLRRDQGICYVCHQPGADQVDHIQPGDDHSYTNLAAIHAVPCHQDKTKRESADARRR